MLIFECRYTSQVPLNGFFIPEAGQKLHLFRPRPQVGILADRDDRMRRPCNIWGPSGGFGPGAQRSGSGTSGGQGAEAGNASSGGTSFGGEGVEGLRFLEEDPGPNCETRRLPVKTA